MSDFPGFAAAQKEYDNRTPPEDGPCECPDCEGAGYITTSDGQGNTDDEPCTECDGTGVVDENGEPFNPHAAEDAAEARADRQRDERDNTDN